MHGGAGGHEWVSDDDGIAWVINGGNGVDSGTGGELENVAIAFDISGEIRVPAPESGSEWVLNWDCTAGAVARAVDGDHVV